MGKNGKAKQPSGARPEGKRKGRSSNVLTYAGAAIVVAIVAIGLQMAGILPSRSAVPQPPPDVPADVPPELHNKQQRQRQQQQQQQQPPKPKHNTPKREPVGPIDPGCVTMMRAAGSGRVAASAMPTPSS